MGLLQPLYVEPLLQLCHRESPRQPTGWMGRSPRTGPFPANLPGFQQFAALGLSELDVVSGLELIALPWEFPLLGTSAQEGPQGLCDPGGAFSSVTAHTSRSRAFPLCRN